MLDPGDFLEPVNVQMGTLRVRVRSGSTGTPLVDSRVTLRQQDTQTGCTVNSLTAFVNNTGSDGEHTFVVPFGTYRVCANNVSGTLRRRESVGPAGTGTPTRRATCGWPRPAR